MRRMPILVVWTMLSAFAPSVTKAGDEIDFARDIQPIFAKHCVKCHGAARPRAEVRLDSGAGVLRGGVTGRVVLPKNAKDSRLVQAIRGGTKDVVAMPFGDRPRLSADEIAKIEAWIIQGAKIPAKETTAAVKNANHWAFQTPIRLTPPKVKNESWPRNPIDRFILARLESENLTPSPEADRTTLLRRLSLDLTGLPPTIHEIDDFLADRHADAYERVVDRLLTSPHYGERWGRHWLDLARYADSNGFNIDAPRTIWPYRDWVITALNRDLPFDRFVIEQLAGDMLPDATIETKVATGFHRNTLINQEGGIDLEQFRIESIVDRVNTTGAVFLGLTLGCAQCHDHKFDPISQREYYELFAFFNNCDEPSLPLPTPEQTRQLKTLRDRQAELKAALKGLDRTSPQRQAEWEKNLTPEVRLRFPPAIKDILDKPDYQRTGTEKQTLAEVLRQLDQVPQFLAGLGDPLASDLAASGQLVSHLHLIAYRTHLEKKLAELKKQEPNIVKTMILQERKTPRETHIHLKGDFLRKGRKVSPGTPEVLPPLSSRDSPNRLDLACWLVSRANPLTARVFVNRVWQAYFGLGLVETENDFGTQGTPPSHPELLDWLAVEFMNDWSMKKLHRLVVTSATYRQASKYRSELANVDPRNRLLARQNRLRLEAEVVRDVALAASGLLNPKIGGPSVFPPQPEGVFAFTQIQREWQVSAGADKFRRGLYTHFWRSAPHPALMAFDAPDSTSTCTRRNRSNTPLQALTLLNDKAFFEFAQGLAVRVNKECPGDDADKVAYAFRLCLGRHPSEREASRLQNLLSALLRQLSENHDEARRLAPQNIPTGVSQAQGSAWTLLGRVLLNLDEFITRE